MVEPETTLFVSAQHQVDAGHRSQERGDFSDARRVSHIHMRDLMIRDGERVAGPGVESVSAELIADREHLVFMHDLSDIRYCPPAIADYGGRGLWKGENAGETRLRIGIVDSAVAQSISIQDFASRNAITLDSADHAIDLAIMSVPGRAEDMTQLLGNELFSPQGHWFWFTLNEKQGPYTFPRAAASL